MGLGVWGEGGAAARLQQLLCLTLTLTLTLALTLPQP